MSNKQIYSDNSDNNNFSNTQITNNFDKINIKNIKEVEPTIKNINNDSNIIIDELVNLIIKEINEGKNGWKMKQHVINHIDSYNMFLKKFYVDLLNNQNNSNSIYLLGYFNFYGIGTDLNRKNGIKLYQKAAELQNLAAQLDLAREYIYEKNCINPKLAFELCEKLAKEEYADGLNSLGYCYEHEIGVDANEEKAFELYQKAANLGNSYGIYNLSWCYKYGIGTNVNKQKANELFLKAKQYVV